MRISRHVELQKIEFEDGEAFVYFLVEDPVDSMKHPYLEITEVPVGEDGLRQVVEIARLQLLSRLKSLTNSVEKTD